MYKVVFFAKLREELGTGQLDFSAENVSTTADLRESLVTSHTAQWRDSLFADNVIVAVNQEVVDWSHELQPGDEVAFFPPVTGG